LLNIIYINLFFFLDCWNYEPENRPIINEVVAKLNAIISNKLSSEQPFNDSSYNVLFQNIQNFHKLSIKEIEPSIPLNEIELGKIVDKLASLLANIEEGRVKKEIHYFLNNHNVTLQEIYKWLLNNQNYSNSIFLLGLFNHCGIEINVDKQKAFELYEKAANLGNAFATDNLGNCYEDGIGTYVNRKKAFELYKKSANMGNVSGINNLGNCYNIGVGTDVDDAKAFELYQLAANLGNVTGIYNLGYCFESGTGTSVNKKMAFELYQKAANLGSIGAQCDLAFMYENGVGVVKNINLAIYWYKKSSEQGNQDAQKNLTKLLAL
jgi:TPR repeat protein